MIHRTRLPVEVDLYTLEDLDEVDRYGNPVVTLSEAPVRTRVALAPLVGNEERRDRDRTEEEWNVLALPSAPFTEFAVFDWLSRPGWRLRVAEVPRILYAGRRVDHVEFRAVRVRG